MNIVTFLFQNARWIAIAFGLLLGSTALWNGYQYIRNSAQNEVRIEQLISDKEALTRTIEQQNRVIEFQKTLVTIADKTISDRDSEVEALRDRYRSLSTQDLGDDLNDQAPDSLKELIRRMNTK